MPRPDITTYVHGNASDFHAAMRRVRGDGTSTAQHVRAAFATMASFGRGLLGGLAAGGVVGTVSQLAQVAESIAEIGDEAKRAGLSVKDFQQLKFVAEQNRIDVEALVDGIKELNLRADEFVETGGGSAAEAFQRLGYNATDLREKLKDPSALFTEIIGKLQRLDEAARIRIADEIFGGSGGEKFVQLIELGEQGIRDQIQAANDLGVVMDEQLIEKADQLDKAFKTVSTTVSTYLQRAIIRAAGDLWSFLELFQNWESARKGTVDDRLAALGKERLSTENQILKLQDRQRQASGYNPWGEDFEGQMVEARQRLSEIADEEERILAARKNSADLAKPTPSSATARSIVPSGSGSTDRGRRSSTDAAEREAEAVRRLVAELEEELRLVGASDTEKQISATLRRANVDAASAEGQQIAGLITQIEAETAARQKQKEAVEQQKQAFENLFQMGEGALLAMLDNSQKAEDAIKRLAIQLALAAAQAALLGSGPLAGLFGGGLFGGGSGLNYFPPAPTVPLPFLSAPAIAAAPLLSRSSDNSPSPSPGLIKVDVSGARGNAEIMEMVGQGVREGLRQYDREAGPSMVKRVVNDPRAVG